MRAMVLHVAALMLGGGIAVAAGPPAANQHTLLLAHFDQKLAADFALGDPVAEVDGAELVESGKWGGAVRPGENQTLSCVGVGNRDTSARTMMFWFQPQQAVHFTRCHALRSLGLGGEPRSARSQRGLV